MSRQRIDHTGRVPRSPLPRPQNTDGSGEDVHPAITFGCIGTVVASLLAAVIYAMSPFTYASGTVYYSGMASAESSMSHLMVDGEKERVQARHAVDFSLILTPADQEVSKTMRRVAGDCLPVKYQRAVQPKQAHAGFEHATEYLACAMKRSTKRFCDVAERQRLVAQLLQYKDRRQSVLGYERSRDELLSSPMAKQHVKDFATVAALSGKPVSLNFPSIGPELDERIASSIMALNRAGYLTASDFSTFGLFLPVEYAPYLSRSEAGSPAC